MSYAELIYVSTSANRFAQAADISSAGLVALGSGRFISLWNSSADATLKSVFVQAHTSGVATLAVGAGCAATGSSDGSVKLWTMPDAADKQGAPREAQTIRMRKGFPLSVALGSLPGTHAPTHSWMHTGALLAVGCTDRNVHLYTRADDNFVPAAVLPGHEDWVKCLAFKPPESEGNPLVLASGSQDSTIRLWNIEAFARGALGASALQTDTGGDATDELLDAFEASLVDLQDADDGGRQISLKRHVLTVKSSSESPQLFSVTFDALLVGHEAGVTSLAWRPVQGASTSPTLLSTSTDSSLILWSPSTVLAGDDGAATLWINRQRFGDVGGQRLGGFVGGLWAARGRTALAWGGMAAGGGGHAPLEWEEVAALTGHRGAVRSVAWSPGGELLVSSGVDQTTRVHASVRTREISNRDEEEEANGSERAWHELGRPQVHGYDLVGAAFVGPLELVSVADEKVARVFEAPREFVDAARNLGVADFGAEGERPRAAALPPLGLSNKALTDMSAVAEVHPEGDPARTRRRPFEGELAAATLWPETEKVFGHGYESITLAVSTARSLVATACRATAPEHAVVRAYDARTWRPVGAPLAGHSLTVTRVAFSPDDALVLTVSRDRTWRLFARDDGELGEGYVPVAAERAHGRIVWDCAWAPEGDAFATASRDKTVKVWRQVEAGDHKWTAVATIAVDAAATAVAFAPAPGDQETTRRTLAIGLESGEIQIYTSPRDKPAQWKKALTIGNRLAHIDHVHCLAWRPAEAQRDGHGISLASCGEDGTLKLLTVHIAAE
ncbi:WD40 repeat-like protein [Epithele typhae]|uniref:WD40 repeat-like protein n=1 Tax=Epithele typhae TaxID=378194 RepID=UPI0020086865|nr:WD40 repeat-like protein [Epithele typhae]KAH9943104.1 WD40 repeat-like protein [Epithele typhae]